MSKLIKRYGAATAGYKALSQVALNAAAGSRTVAWNVRDVSKIGVVVKLTARAAATSLVITPYVSLDGGTTYCQMHSESAGTLAAWAVEKAGITTTDEIEHEFDVSSADFVKFVFSGASGGAGDLVDVYISGAQV